MGYNSVFKGLMRAHSNVTSALTDKKTSKNEWTRAVGISFNFIV